MRFKLFRNPHILSKSIYTETDFVITKEALSIISNIQIHFLLLRLKNDFSILNAKNVSLN